MKKKKMKDILKFVFAVASAVFYLVAFPVLMAIAIYEYALCCQDYSNPTVQEQINKETMIQGGFGGY